MPAGSRTVRTPWLRLMVGAAGSELLYVLLGRLADQPQSSVLFETTLPFFGLWTGLLSLYAVAAHAVRNASGKAVFGFILATSVLFRLTLLPARGLDTQVRPSLVDSAQSPIGRWMVEKAPLLDPIPSRLGLGETPAPVARVLITGVDLVALALAPSLLRSAGIPTGASILYGWSPLAVKETAGSGRMEPVGLLLLALALATERRGARLASSLAYGASLLTSIWGAACLALFIRRLGMISFLGVGAAAIGWTLSWQDSLDTVRLAPTFIGGSLFPAAVALAKVFLTRNPVYPAIACLGGWAAFVLYRTVRRGQDPLPRECLLCLGGLMMVAPEVHPWSFLVLAYVSGFSRNRGWPVFAATAPLTYIGLASGTWSFWLAFAQYVPPYCAVIFGWLGGSSRSKPST